MSVTEASRIAAAGIPLNLGGRDVRVRFTTRSWKEAEERFGSLEAAFNTLRRMLGGEGVEPLDKPVGPTIALLSMALIHEGLSEDQVYDLSDVHDLSTYQRALLDALAEGTPAPGSGKDEGAASPGPTTTTPSPSDTAAAMASSGV